MANSDHEMIINMGVKVWNQWRKDNPKVKPDLSKADIKVRNLSGANFSHTDFFETFLINKNFSKANFQKASLDFAQTRHSNFENTNFKEASFVGTSMREANLYCANLNGACFREARLFDANFSKTNLQQARFVMSQLLGVKFSGANLTGACIENCNINSQTDFSNVICNYIYFQQNDRDRRPHDPGKFFTQGEFSKLFKQVIETVDIVFSNGINWQAFLHSFQKLQIECNSEELAIQAIEKKSSESLVIRVEVPSDANKSEIEKYLENEYQLELQSIEEKYKLQLCAKEEKINLYHQQNTNLFRIIELQAQQPINQNNFMSNINQHHSGNGDNIGRDKNVHNINDSLELKQTIENIQALLEKLEQTYNPNTTTGKMTIATKAIEYIEKDRNLTQRVLSSLEKGGTAWLQAKLINPSASFLIAALEDWQKTKQ
ncbi:MAG: hypothetical protein Tsb0014_23560 [Pleurocapsa sp.]